MTSSIGGTLRATFSPDIGIDLGTANTVVYSHDAGVLVSEPSVVAYRTTDDAIVAVGSAAKELDGRGPGSIRVVRPLRGGTISDFRGAHALVKTLVDRALARGQRLAPRVVACVPGCATDIECKAVEEAIRAAGPRTTTFVPQAVAAAVGAGLDITGTRPAMVIDIGGGTTEIAVLTLCGVVAMSSIKIGGDTFDAAIVQRLRQELFAIGPLTAERLKIERGYAGRPPGLDPYFIAGTDMAGLRPGRRAVPETLVGRGHARRDRQDRPRGLVDPRADPARPRRRADGSGHRADRRRRADPRARRRDRPPHERADDGCRRSAGVRRTRRR